MLAVYGWTARIAGPTILIFGAVLFAAAGNFEAHVASAGIVGVGFVVGVVGELLLLHLRRSREITRS